MNETIETRLTYLGFIISKAKLYHNGVWKCATIYKPRKITGWYIISDKFVNYGDWREIIPAGWFWIDEPKQLTTEERRQYAIELKKAQEAIIQQREQDRIQRIQEIADFTDKVLPIITTQAKTHAYLERKQAKFRHDFTVNKHDKLVIPIYNIDRQITGYQFISAEGEKNYKTGSYPTGSFYPLRNRGVNIADAEWFIFCEGYATADAVEQLVEEYTDGKFFIVINCLSAHNLRTVVKIFGNKYPKAEQLVIADCGDIGIRSAQNTGAKYFTMHYADSKDANDALVEFGMEKALKLFDNNMKGL